MQAVRLLPGQQDLGGAAGLHREGRAERHGVAQTDRSFGGGHADAVLSLATIELGGLPGVIPQSGEHGAGRGEQTVLARGRGELAEAAAEHEAPLHVARDEAMVLERDGQTVGGGAGEPGRLDELRECRRTCFEGAQHHGGLVEHADAAAAVIGVGGVHAGIMPS